MTATLPATEPTDATTNPVTDPDTSPARTDAALLVVLDEWVAEHDGRKPTRDEAMAATGTGTGRATRLLGELDRRHDWPAARSRGTGTRSGTGTGAGTRSRSARPARTGRPTGPATGPASGTGTGAGTGTPAVPPTGTADGSPTGTAAAPVPAAPVPDVPGVLGWVGRTLAQLRTAGPAPADPGHPGEPAAARPGRVRGWPLVLLAAPAFVAIWSGWVGLGALTGFGPVHPLPGIADSFTINSAITLPIGVETYAAYALRVWLAGHGSARARTFARRSSIGALVLGALGQVAYHLMTAAHLTGAPWPITTAVACLPVVVLGFGAALAHLQHTTDSTGRPPA